MTERKTVSLFPGQELLVKVFQLLPRREPQSLRRLGSYVTAHIDTLRDARGKRYPDNLALALDSGDEPTKLAINLRRDKITPEKAMQKITHLLIRSGWDEDDAPDMAGFVVSQHLHLR